MNETSALISRAGQLLFLSVAGTTLCLGVALHEWLYRQQHPHRHGVSTVLIVLAVGAACVGAAIVTVAWPLYQEASRRRIDWKLYRQQHDESVNDE